MMPYYINNLTGTIYILLIVNDKINQINQKYKSKRESNKIKPYFKLNKRILIVHKS